jgi:hypothetical protein
LTFAYRLITVGNMTTYKDDRDLRQLVRAAIGQNGTQKAYADAVGISEAYLSDFLQGRRGAGPAILGALGFEATPYYRKAD